MISYKAKKNLLKITSLFATIRGYNVFILVFAQYLASIFIFSSELSISVIFFDFQLFLIIIATVCVVSSGYIINNFYDSKLDQINKPIRIKLNNYVQQATKLKLYFTLNFIGFIFASLVSWKAAFFFSVYIFGIWFYSHKLKKYPFTGLISATTLTLLPFFAVFVYFKNFSTLIFVHATFLFLLLMSRELLKNLENVKGAIANNYKTFLVVYGEKNTKKLAIILLFSTYIPIVILLKNDEINAMKYYFYFIGISIVFTNYFIWKSSKINQYRNLHTFLKIVLLIGVFSLILIKPNLIF